LRAAVAKLAARNGKFKTTTRERRPGAEQIFVLMNAEALLTAAEALVCRRRRRGRRRRRRCRRRSRGRILQGGIDPAALHPPVQAVRGLWIDRVGMQYQAAESRLNMAARAAETVVEVEVPERGVEIVPPQQADHPVAEPDAFGIAGRTVERVLRLGIFVDFLALVRGGRSRGCWLVARAWRSALSERANGNDETGGKAQPADDAEYSVTHGSLELSWVT
jgi:hypothetical protein